MPCVQAKLVLVSMTVHFVSVDNTPGCVESVGTSHQLHPNAICSFKPTTHMVKDLMGGWGHTKGGQQDLCIYFHNIIFSFSFTNS